MKQFPEQYKQQLADAYNIHNQNVTFEKRHEVVGTLDFDHDYIANYDFDNLPEHLAYKDSFNTLTGKREFVNIIVNDMNDQFLESVRHFAEEVCKFTYWEGHLLHFITGVTPLHRDIHLGIRKRNDLFAHISDEELYSKMRKFWIPLGDRKPGQFFEVNGIPIVEWKAGDLIEFQSRWPHCGATCGPDARNALVLTGTTIKK